MSEETQIQQQEQDKPTQSYISRVRLKGYKSIIDTEVTFKPGLNIIIGANGSGKTNFVEFLGKIFHGDFDEISENYNAFINAFVNQKELEYNLDYRLSVLENSNDFVPVFKEKLTFDNIPISTVDKTHSTLIHFPIITFNPHWRELSPFYISYGIPKEFQLDTLIKLEYSLLNNLNSTDVTYFRKPSFTMGLQELLDKIFAEKIFDDENVPALDEQDLVPLEFKNNLSKFTTIYDVKVSKNFNVKNIQSKWIIDYIRFEFLVQDNWLTWNQLSDGTKRMFYIITEITFANNIVLLEEPELGIHPDQLRKLMSFLREQAQEKQIIITTHSPQVLNALAADELDRIIIARYEKEAGTKLYHLTEEEMEHARSYMETEGLFLSDYWVYSGFEKEEEAV